MKCSFTPCWMLQKILALLVIQGLLSSTNVFGKPRVFEFVE